jgi:hypothetical protein
VTVQRFSANTGRDVVLEADWTLATGNPPKAGAIHHVGITKTAGSTEGGAVAGAMSQALEGLAENVSRAME